MIDYYRDWFTREKFERIYSKSSEFSDWLELAEKNKDLIEGQEIPFDIKKVCEKAQAIINVRK